MRLGVPGGAGGGCLLWAESGPGSLDGQRIFRCYPEITMGRVYLYLFIYVAVALGTCARLHAQADPDVPSTHVKTMPAPSDGDGMPVGHVKQLPAPEAAEGGAAFSSERTNSLSHSIQMISEAEMSRADRDLVADAQSSIQERAGFENLEFDNGGWIYHELVCPALPNHLFLRFTRDDGTRQMSMFSASIPRDGNGRVHIIPIVRKGYSLFSPAPVGALTVAALTVFAGKKAIDRQPTGWVQDSATLPRGESANTGIGRR